MAQVNWNLTVPWLPTFLNLWGEGFPLRVNVEIQVGCVCQDFHHCDKNNRDKQPKEGNFSFSHDFRGFSPWLLGFDVTEFQGGGSMRQRRPLTSWAVTKYRERQEWIRVRGRLPFPLPWPTYSKPGLISMVQSYFSWSNPLCMHSQRLTWRLLF